MNKPRCSLFSPAQLGVLIACALVAISLGSRCAFAQNTTTEQNAQSEGRTHDASEGASEDRAEKAGEAGRGEAAHDAYDLSHNNATEDIDDMLEWRSDLALWTLVVFLLLLAVLWKFAWKPISEGLAKREKAIADNIEEAKRNAERTEAMAKEYEQKLAAAATEAQQTIAAARKQAEAASEKIVADAQAAAERERKRALEEIRGAKEAALEEITQQSVNTAVMLAGRLVQKEINRDDHDQLIRDALAKMPSQN